MMEIYEKLPKALLPWYKVNKRDLPWRLDRDPYHIWISEIMLQQTRVEAVKGYYPRFLSVCPDVSSLAKVDDGVLHKLWEGLGYYSRVRNLKKAAQKIVAEHGGAFPEAYESVLALPGVGVYTAGAVCSIAYNQKTPAVDGNVLRVISRLTDDDTPVDRPTYVAEVRKALQSIYPREAGEFTQALMELGATVCGPNREPRCAECPCFAFCRGRLNGRAAELPIKSPKKTRKIEQRTVFVFSVDGLYALEKREDKGLLAGLWQFPNILGDFDMTNAVAEAEKMGLRPKELLRQVDRKHIFTHIEWKMRGIYMEVSSVNDSFVWMTKDQIRAEAALPTAFRQFFDELDR